MRTEAITLPDSLMRSVKIKSNLQITNTLSDITFAEKNFATEESKHDT